MSCVLVCFNGLNHKKRRLSTNVTPHTDQISGVNDQLDVAKTEEEQPIIVTQPKENHEEECISNEKKKVTFDPNVKVHELEHEKEEEPSNGMKSDSNPISINGDGYQNRVEEESSESLFSILLIDSDSEVGEKEVSSPMPKCSSSRLVLKAIESECEDRNHRNVDFVLNSVENLNQCKAMDMKAARTVHTNHQDKENINLENRPVLGEVAAKEVDKVFANTCPRTPVIGTIQSYWSRTGQHMESDSDSSSSKGRRIMAEMDAS
ncbi:uncharacterized protein LOC126674017 [Mercurialis annua]|uniref:uncharacterized protein LOC126674017 n=1 Tax=Mercurialis annua TaxID=3986 RepID=UPI0021608C10|nr:uncharacterized protein LOC126674017 [Mercurialis annua]